MIQNPFPTNFGGKNIQLMIKKGWFPKIKQADFNPKEYRYEEVIGTMDNGSYRKLTDRFMKNLNVQKTKKAKKAKPMEIDKSGKEEL